MPESTKRFRVGSIIPILLINSDRADPEYNNPQMRPNLGEISCRPIKKISSVVKKPASADTNRAANSIL